MKPRLINSSVPVGNYVKIRHCGCGANTHQNQYGFYLGEWQDSAMGRVYRVKIPPSRECNAREIVDVQISPEEEKQNKLLKIKNILSNFIN